MTNAHPADGVLDSVLRMIRPLYNAPKQRTETRIRAFLKPKLKTLARRDGESAQEYRTRLQAYFSGVRWALLKRQIAADFTAANAQATEYVNQVLEKAFEAGLNESAYALSLTGVAAIPITVGAVVQLVRNRAIVLNKRKLNKSKDKAYNEQRIQSAVASVIILGYAATEIPARIAAAIANARMNESIAAARAYVYSASDTGAYTAGLEAEKSGLEVEKTWMSIMDARVRPSHYRLNGVTISIDEVFRGIYGTLRYPHDPEAPAQEIYRCRCRMAVHLAGKSPGEYGRNLLPSQTAKYQEWREKQIRRLGTDLEIANAHKRRLKGAG